MKVIDHHFPPGEDIYQGTCPRCRTVVQAAHSETTQEGGGHVNVGQPSKRRRFVKCPNCSVGTTAIYLGDPLPKVTAPLAPIVPAPIAPAAEIPRGNPSVRK